MLASVRELIPSLGSEAPPKAIESPLPLKLKVRLVALGLKKWAGIGKSGVTPPGRAAKPGVAKSRNPGVFPVRLDKVTDWMFPSLLADTENPPVEVSKEPASCISMNCTVPDALEK